MANKQVAVIGLGRFGISTTRTLYNLGYDVLAIDMNEEKVQSVLGQCTYAVTADCTNENALRDLGIKDYEVVIITIQNDIAQSVMVSVLLKTLQVHSVIARARDSLHANTLRRVGVDRVIQPEEEMGARLAHSLYNANVEEYLSVTNNYGVSRFRVPSRFNGKSLEDAGFTNARDSYGISALALCKGRKITLNPSLSEKLKEGYLVVVAAHDSDLESLEKDNHSKH
jgi:trk system potassium uptake protein TrkA